MPIIATFSAAALDITVNGLHQWDYGQQLEIRAGGLPVVVEVHFSYPGAREAIVRSCNAASGVVTVAIPDVCLEQSGLVQVWVYEVGTTSGRTIRTVNLPIIPRPRPALTPSDPETYSDKYTEAVGAMEAAVADIKSGNYTAGHATEADHAAAADTATSAGKATADGDGKNIAATYGDFTQAWVTGASKLPAAGAYLIAVPNGFDSSAMQAIVDWHGSRVTVLLGAYYDSNDMANQVTNTVYWARIEADGSLSLFTQTHVQNAPGGSLTGSTTATYDKAFNYKKLIRG